jgi:hypothetical protein
MKQEDCYLELKNFTPEQIYAIKQIYVKYFSNLVPPYDGTAFVALWKRGLVWETGKGMDHLHRNSGICIPECDDDALWNAFNDIIPNMGKGAVISKIPPAHIMRPHIDRKIRPHAIYFPIENCNEKCYSDYYDFPVSDTVTNQVKNHLSKPKFTYSITKYPVLTNVKLWHGVRNNSDLTRTAFGWNLNPNTIGYNFDDCKKFFIDMGYA